MSDKAPQSFKNHARFVPMYHFVLFGSLLAVVYVGKLIEALYFQPATDTNISIKEAPLLLLAPIWTLALANIYFGLDTDLTVGVATTAVEVLGAAGK